jgi:hypothetical protein
MRQAIRKVKTKSWEELLNSLDADPWRRPYKLVLGKLRSAAPSVTGSLASDLLSEVVGTLPREGEVYPITSHETYPMARGMGGHGRRNVRGL